MWLVISRSIVTGEIAVNKISQSPRLDVKARMYNTSTAFACAKLQNLYLDFLFVCTIQYMYTHHHNNNNAEHSTQIWKQ